MARKKSLDTDTDRYFAALGPADALESLREAPARLRKLVRGRTEAQLCRRSAPGKWSIKEVVAHLADGEIIVASRIALVAAMDRPKLVAYDQDLFVARLGAARVPTAELLAAFEAARALTVCLLARLRKGSWTRVGLHAERGAESLQMIVRRTAGHDRLHEIQIAAQLAPAKRRVRAR